MGIRGDVLYAMNRFPEQSTLDQSSDEWPCVDEVLAASRLLRASTSVGTANIYIFEKNGVKYLVKSFDKHSLMARWLFGNPTIENEWHILQALKETGIQQVPRAYAKLGKSTLVMEFIEGKQLLSIGHYTQATMPPRAFFEQLRDVLHQCHQAGFAHGDFRRANLLICDEQSPCILDWATATYCPPGVFSWRLLKKAFNRQQKKSDHYSLLKIIDSYYPEMLTTEERRRGQPNWLLRFARYLRLHLYRHGIKKWLKRSRHDEPQ